MNEPPDSLRRVFGLPLGGVAGFFYPLQAVGLLLRTPKLWVGVVFPIALNVILEILLYSGLLIPGWRFITQSTAGVSEWLAQRIATLPGWAVRLLSWVPAAAGWLDDLLGWLLAIVLLIVTGLLLVQFGAIVGAPWYGGLSEQIEKQRLGTLPSAQFSVQRAIADVWRAIAFQLKKLALTIAIGLPLLLLNLLPLPVIATSIASIGGVALASFLVGLDFLDPPLERRRLRFRDKLALFGRSLPASASFSWVCLILVSIPFLNLLVVPICVIAGTLFACDRVLPYLPDSQPKPGNQTLQ